MPFKDLGKNGISLSKQWALDGKESMKIIADKLGEYTKFLIESAKRLTAFAVPPNQSKGGFFGGVSFKLPEKEGTTTLEAIIKLLDSFNPEAQTFTEIANEIDVVCKDIHSWRHNKGVENKSLFDSGEKVLKEGTNLLAKYEKSKLKYEQMVKLLDGLITSGIKDKKYFEAKVQFSSAEEAYLSDYKAVTQYYDSTKDSIADILNGLESNEIDRIEFLKECFKQIMEIKITKYKDLFRTLESLQDFPRIMKPSTDISVLVKAGNASSEDAKIEIADLRTQAINMDFGDYGPITQYKNKSAGAAMNMNMNMNTMDPSMMNYQMAMMGGYAMNMTMNTPMTPTKPPPQLPSQPPPSIPPKLPSKQSASPAPVSMQSSMDFDDFSFSSTPSQPQNYGGGFGGNIGSSRKCKAMYDYMATADGVLSIRANEIIENIEDYDSSWYKGTIRGQTGLVPRSYVQEISGAAAIMPTSTPAKPAQQTKYRGVCKAIYNYQATIPTALSLTAGEELRFCQEGGEGWFTAVNSSGKEGLIPKSYVQVVQNP